MILFDILPNVSLFISESMHDYQIYSTSMYKFSYNNKYIQVAFPSCEHGLYGFVLTSTDHLHGPEVFH